MRKLTLILILNVCYSSGDVRGLYTVSFVAFKTCEKQPAHVKRRGGEVGYRGAVVRAPFTPFRSLNSEVFGNK